MKTFRTLFLLCFLPGSIFAQSFGGLDNNKGDNAFTENTFLVFARYTTVSAKYTESYSGFTVNLRLRNDKYERGEWCWRFENSTLGDLIFLLFNIEEMDGRKTEQAFGNGFLGSHQFYGNLVATDRLLISPGFSMGDYIFASKRENADSTGARILDPAGYFLSVGPAFKISYVITEKLWLDGYAYYDIGFQVGKPSGEYNQTKGYERPGFLSIGGDIHHAGTRLFAGARLMQMIDNGANKDSATRIDISFGYMF
jgi:hypothetical protein